MTIVVAVCAVLLSMAVALIMVRLIKGPSVLDRLVAVDMLLATIVCGLGVSVVATGETTIVTVLLVVALLGFVGSASVARFVSLEKKQADW